MNSTGFDGSLPPVVRQLSEQNSRASEISRSAHTHETLRSSSRSEIDTPRVGSEGNCLTGACTNFLMFLISANFVIFMIFGVAAIPFIIYVIRVRAHNWDFSSQSSRATVYMYYTYSECPIMMLLIFAFILWRVAEKIELGRDDPEAVKLGLRAWLLILEACAFCVVIINIDLYRPGASQSTYYFLSGGASAVLLLFVWGAASAFCEATREMLKHRGPTRFNLYVRKTAIPCVIGLVVLQMYVTATMFQTGDQFIAVSTPGVPRMPAKWSSGCAAIGVNFNLAATGIFGIYLLGSGILKPKEFGTHLLQSTADDTELQAKRNSRLAQLEFLFLIGVFQVVYFFSFSGTAFNFGDLRFYMCVAFNIILWVFVGCKVYDLQHAVNQNNPEHALHVSGKKHHFFISHAQNYGQDQVHAIAMQLRQRDYQVWRDMDESDITLAGMMQGIDDTIVLMVFLTTDPENGSCLKRPYVHHEVKHALDQEVPVILVYETDRRHGGSDDFGDFIKGAPEDLQDEGLFKENEAIAYHRRRRQQDAMYDDIIAQFKEKFEKRYEKDIHRQTITRHRAPSLQVDGADGYRDRSLTRRLISNEENLRHV